jgi:hypothetical protein
MIFQILSEKDEKHGQLPTALFTETGGIQSLAASVEKNTVQPL